jgi:SAM-dependent methyltransferase
MTIDQVAETRQLSSPEGERLPDVSRIRSLILEVRKKLPPALWADVPEIIDKDLLHVQLTYVRNGRLIDLAGGYSPTSAVLARLGMEVTVVDTFGSTKFYEQFSAQQLCDVLQSFGVKLVRADLREYDPATAFEPASVDAISFFEAIYYFNPRQLLDRCMRVLRPGGKLVVECNNAVSLLRRLRVLLGRNNAGPFQEYFIDDVHKRFWVKSDVQALARYLKVSEFHLIGRNWSLYQSRKELPKSALRLADNTLRTSPGLCNDIYLIGKK